MDRINIVIMWVMMAFMVLAAIDRIFDQFGGAETVLGKLGLGRAGRAFQGAGKQLEEGFMAMGPLALAMIGVMALAPVLARILGELVTPICISLGANPAMFATTLLAMDMGGFSLAQELSGAIRPPGCMQVLSWDP